MPQRARVQRSAFSKGIITEVNPLNYPPDTARVLENVVLSRDGSAERRLGMDIEDSVSYTDTGKAPLVFDSNSVRSFRWSSPDNDVALSFGVVQIGSTLFFYDLYKDKISDNLIGSLQFNTASVGYNISGNTMMDFASIDGKLVVVSKELQEPQLVSYDSSVGTFSTEDIDIRVRDIWGVDDGLETADRPGTISQSHLYNLVNQGWPDEAVPVGGGGTEIPHVRFNTDAGDYPSNSDVWYSFVRAGTGGGATEVFDADTYATATFGNTPAAKGHFIISAFNRSQDRLASTSLVSSLVDDADSGKVSVVASYAGRIWYSGVESQNSGGDDKSPNYSGTLFFSQIIENNSQFGRCYQESDPTAEDINELVATDGGTIKIPEAGNIIGLRRVGASLVVIADNGVWEITGPDQVFKADDFSITQVTTTGSVSKQSIVPVEDSLVYWADAGIYSLNPDSRSGRLTATNLTEQSIQTLYEGINIVGRANSVGTFDSISRKVRWLYNDTDDYDGITLRKKYNKELVFDTVLGAFYSHEIQDAATDSPFLAGYMPVEEYITTPVSQTVVVNGEEVQVNGETVVVTSDSRSRGITETKYIVIKPNEFSTNYGLAFGYYWNSDFEDWSETDAAAVAETGTEVYEDPYNRKQANYLMCHFLRTETGFTDDGLGNLTAVSPSGCLVRAKWDFSDSSVSGKWGSQQQVYRLRRNYIPTGSGDSFDYGHEVITTKSRLRGSGKSLALRFESQSGKDMKLLGWSYGVTLGDES